MTELYQPLMMLSAQLIIEKRFHLRHFTLCHGVLHRYRGMIMRT